MQDNLILGLIQIINAQIPNRLIDKIIAIGGEGIDRSFTGLYDRNQLALADKEHTVTTVLSGSGGVTGGIDSFNSTIFNSKPDFAVLTGCDNTTELVITINLNSTLQNYSRGLWQPFVQTRLGNAQYFRNIAVEVMDGNNVWYTPANLIANNISTISNSGLYLFSETSVGTAAIRGVRFKLSNPLTSNGVVYLSNIGLRHISHTFAPQFPHRGDNNTFYGNNTFTQSPVIPNGTLVTHAVNLNQLNNAIGSHTHAFADITLKPTTLAGYGITDGYKSTYLLSKIIGSVATTLDAELPNGGFITSYTTGSWGGSDRPTGASFGGYIKFARGTGGADNNNLDFYYNNGHNGTESKLWFRTKDSAGINDWLEIATREWSAINSLKIRQTLLTTNANNVDANSTGTLYYLNLANSPYPTSQDVIGSMTNLGGKEFGLDLASTSLSGGRFYLRSYSSANTPNSWQEIATKEWSNNQFALSSHTHTFASITSKPTTLSGYGITDAIPTSHPVNGVNATQINHWNSAFSWGNHAAAGYATSDFVDESIAQISTEFINPDYPISASGRINNVIITEEFTKEYLELEAELIPERQITVTNLAPFDIDVKREDHSIDIVRARETTEYYITAERRLIKKGSYHSAAFLN